MILILIIECLVEKVRFFFGPCVDFFLQNQAAQRKGHALEQGWGWGYRIFTWRSAANLKETSSYEFLPFFLVWGNNVRLKDVSEALKSSGFLGFIKC